jgi:uncharacterized protein YjbI with pentapeptide repeats
MGIICGLLLAYFRFPYLEDQHALTLGLAGGLAISFLLVLIFKGKDQTVHQLFILSLSCLLILGLFLGIFYLNEKDRLAEEEQLQEKREILQAELSKAYKQAKNNQLRLVDFEMLALRERLAKLNATQLNRDEIKRIQELSELLKPIESKIDSAYSPGRGRLLLHLLQLKIDSASRKEVIKSTNFNYADLSYEDLSNSDLSEINLKYSNLKNVKLHNAILNQAVLEEANLWGAELIRAQFRNAVLVNCSLNWSRLDHADFSSAVMHGAELSYSFGDSVKFNSAKLKWAKVIGATFRNSELKKTDLFRATLKETTINHSDLSGAKLFKSYLIKSDFSNSTLDQATVKQQWLSKINQNQLINAAEIKQYYSLDSTKRKENTLYFLRANK